MKLKAGIFLYRLVVAGYFIFLHIDLMVIISARVEARCINGRKSASAKYNICDGDLMK